ncbi:MAG TPA: Maf family protein [Candidatus Dormibacteraeota bacterium]|nr:Maf family protein [Candidatus Dormibacteraeota bacterium]
MPKLVLASGSDRRRELLVRLGLRFTVVRPEIDETLAPGMCADLAVQLVARAKAHAAISMLKEGVAAYVLAADTVVVGPSGPMGKPGSELRAKEMLRQLRGHRHVVLTGICALCPATMKEGTAVSRSAVRMREFSDEELEQYVAGGEPLDKAGAYAVQGLGGSLVDAIGGRTDTVIGLDCQMAMQLLNEVGYPNPLPTAPDHSVPLGKSATTRRPLASSNRSGGSR